MPMLRVGVAVIALFIVVQLCPQNAAAQSPIEPGEQLTLRKAVDLALRNHPSGLAARSEASAVGERVGEARAQMLPQVYGSAQYLGATDNGVGDASYLNPGYIPRIPGTTHNRSADASQGFVPENNYGIAVGASQFLFDFGRHRGFVKEREYESAAARADSKLTDLDLTYEASQRYFALLAAHQKLKVYDQAVAERAEDLHAAQVKASAGLVPEIDVTTAQAELARAKVQLLDAQNLEQTSKVALDNAMGLDADAPDYKLAGVLTYHPLTGDLAAYYATALRLRPDLAEIQNQVLAAGAKISQYRSDLFPTVAAVAGYNALGTTTPAANNYDAGIMISWPIFNGFETEHQIAEAKFHRDALRHRIEALRQRVYLQVKSAFLDWQTSLERIQRTQLTLAASRARLELATKRYGAGLGNIIELTDAERFYIDDNAAYIDALYDFAVTKAALDRATASSSMSIADRN
jgi:outer membrane protein